jgi:hypothetical protein
MLLYKGNCIPHFLFISDRKTISEIGNKNHCVYKDQRYREQIRETISTHFVSALLDINCVDIDACEKRTNIHEGQINPRILKGCSKVGIPTFKKSSLPKNSAWL